MKAIGTILPTAQSLAATDKYAADLAARKEAFARRNLAGLTRRVVALEVRYYRDDSNYAVVVARGAIKAIWFTIRGGETFAAK